MATKITRYIESGLATGAADGTSQADAWPSFAAAIAGIDAAYPSGLVVADVQIDVLCYNTADAADLLSTLVIDTITDSDTYIEFISTGANEYVAEANSATQDYMIRGSATAGQEIRFTGIHFTRALSGSGRTVLQSRRSRFLLDNCKLISTTAGIASRALSITFSDGANYVTNSLIKGWGGSGLYNEANSTMHSINNVFIDNATAINSGSNTKVRNDIFQGSTVTDVTGVTDVDYCLTDAGSLTGANSVISSTLTFADAANDDYSLAAGDTDAIGAGVGPSADADIPTSDYEGDVRSGATTDIGLDLYSVAVVVNPVLTDTLLDAESSNAAIASETNLTIHVYDTDGGTELYSTAAATTDGSGVFTIDDDSVGAVDDTPFVVIKRSNGQTACGTMTVVDGNA